MAMNKNVVSLLTLIVVILLGIVAYGVLNAPDRRTAGEKVGDAVDQLDNGLDNAARELEDRTPAERIGDAVDDAADQR